MTIHSQFTQLDAQTLIEAIDFLHVEDSLIDYDDEIDQLTDAEIDQLMHSYLRCQPVLPPLFADEIYIDDEIPF